MTPRERWCALFANEKPDRIPTDYWATDEVTERLFREMECSTIEALYTKLNIDGVIRVEPPCLKPHHPSDPKSDIWGLRKEDIAYGTGTYAEFATHPLATVETVDEVHDYQWPTADDHDYDAYRNLIANAPSHRFIRTGEFEPFLIYCAMRGMEQAFLDFLEQPDILEAALDHIFDFHYQLNQRTFEIGRGRIDVTYVAEDLGGQSSLLMSVENIREHILPNQKKMADLAKSYGIRVFYHTDGAVREIIPDLIDVTGIELLNPIQWRCTGMEREALVRDFGKKIIFHGAMDNQYTLPFGSTEEVKNEVLENIRIFLDARWVCAPCHNLQPITPMANILTLYETIHEYGRL
ncbi:MAG: uroporphyrinogen decarboxylase family protein [bacterium]